MKSRSAFYGIMTALAIILSYIEFLIPLPVPVVGMKLGLANVVSVFLLYKKGLKPALAVLLCRISIVNILFGSVSGFFFALCGGLFSLILMWILKGTGKFSPIGISAVGGIFHNVGQIAFAAFYLGTTVVFNYLPALALAGVAAGVVTGLISRIMLRIKV